ncbi:hypothetical protein C1H76_6094 [Elsinoe australis]|uniref:DUF1750-domain-containing protein n=1 Tax=Elsinoe australis TaxID=40998 RepID=A0A4U7ATD3_9PEZI|nr:hypothetical protein C1H76_6094 [Elsinoe australis]
MQDPSYGVPNHLAQHVHLVSNQQFPFVGRMHIQQAFKYLFDAPQVVKQHATMSWRYLTAPRDGTVFLTWISPRYNEQFPSDGFLWAGPEERMVQEISGYTIEIAVQHAGYQPQVDSLANHRRTRYRLVQKNPNVNANPPDRNLWLVHYSQAEPNRTLQAGQVQVSRLQQVQIQQRALIEREGQLEHKEFMLHDRDRWPTLRTMRPGSQGMVQGQGNMPPNAMAHMGNPRFGGQHYQQQAQAAVGPSPAKRQRTSMTGAPQAVAQMPEYQDLDVEEEYALGDYLDVLSQRDVSKARYVQHHEWMEEVFSSPYAANQIEPVYLGFGLMGELSGLTKGVFETVEKAAKQYYENAKVEDQSVVQAKISPDQVKDFEKKVNEYLDDGQAEIKRMKEEHAKRMEEWRKGKSITKAEKRLRNARWVEDGTRQSPLNGFASGRGSAEKADDIVKEVETSLGTSIVGKPVSKMVEKGGFKEKIVQPEPEPEPAPVSNGNFEHMNGQNAGVQNPMQMSETARMQQTLQQQQEQHQQQQPPAPQQLQQPPQQPSAGQQPPINAAQQQPQQQQQQQPPSQPSAPPQPQSSMPDTTMDFPTDDNLDTMDTSNFEMEDIDMDIGSNVEINFNDSLDTSTPQNTSSGPGTAGHDASAPAQSALPSSTQPTQTATTQSAPAPQQSLDGATSGAPGQQQQQSQQQGNANQVAASSSAGGGAGDLSFHPTPGDDSAFDEFTAGDGFVDFGDGDEGLGGDMGGAGDGIDLDLGMEGSAFGDAFGGGNSLGGSGAGTPGQGGA